MLIMFVRLHKLGKVGQDPQKGGAGVVESQMTDGNLAQNTQDSQEDVEMERVRAVRKIV